MLAKLVAKANSGVKRVHTKTVTSWNLPDPKSAVEIVSRKTRTLKDGSVKMVLKFANGKTVEVVYREV